MKTVLEYLNECKDMACHNLLCYSKTYGMNTPKEGCEKQFAEAQRDLEIVELLIARQQCYEKNMNTLKSELKTRYIKRNITHALQ